MKWSRWGVVAVALLVVGVAVGCGSTNPPASYTRNPHPSKRYELTVTVENAPGPFASVDGGANYIASNCRYAVSRYNGIFANPNDQLRFALERTAENTWKGVFHADGMLDADYGLEGGMCRWQLHSAGASLRATGSPTDTTFGIAADADEMRAGKTVRVHYIRNEYPSAPLIDADWPYHAVGEEDRSRFGPRIRDEELFTISMEIRKTTP